MFAAALVAGALSVDALKGSDAPFDRRIHVMRRQKGQQQVAAAFRRLLAGSAIRASHLDCERVQDPYSLRCQPQVMGACLDVIRAAATTLQREASAVTDNPLVFPDDGKCVFGRKLPCRTGGIRGRSTGAGDRRDRFDRRAPHRSIGRSEDERTAAVSGRKQRRELRIHVGSGHGRRIGRRKQGLAHPCSVDSIPTSANQEDHVSMATYAARRLLTMADNAAGIIAIELLAAAQGLEFHRPLKSSPSLEKVVALIRSQVRRYTADRYFAPDIAAAKRLVASGLFRAFVSEIAFEI